MKKNLLSLVTFAILSFVTVSMNAQELFSEQSWGWGEEQTLGEYGESRVHTFTMHGTGAGGGAYCPCNTFTESFGLIYSRRGVKPFEVDTHLFSAVLQNRGEHWTSDGNVLTIEDDFFAYDYFTNSFTPIWRMEQSSDSGYIFCWILNNRLWYCWLSANDVEGC